MTARNRYKTYVENGFYHCYNRGVEKRDIFLDQKDYTVFLSYLKFYLSPPINPRGPSPRLSPAQQLSNHNQTIKLIAYCLMPNHFHIMVQQHTYDTINYFMRSLATKYVRYFNTKHNRIGPLFQGTYKAAHITNEYQFTYLTKYIHRNPLSLPAYKESPRRELHTYQYSSYPNYLGQFSQSWITKDDILTYFSNTNPNLSYQNFVEDSEPDDITIIKDYTIDLI